MVLFKKIIHLFQRFGKCAVLFPARWKEFGLRAAMAITIDFLFPPGKSKRYIRTISRRVDKELAPLIEQYLQSDEMGKPLPRKCDIREKLPVWVCWWQGESSMPELVRTCFARLHAVVPEDRAQIHLITMENMEQYISLPPCILEKHHSGQISYAFLSDILRYALLSTYGGFWVDATDYLTQFPEAELLNRAFFTQKFASEDAAPREACRGKWCNFFFAGQPDNLLFRFIYDALLFWLPSHKLMIDYVFLDYLIWTAYCRIPQIRRLIDDVPVNNEHIWVLADRLNDAFDEGEFAQLMQLNGFYKLSYKADLLKTTADGKQTIYGHLLTQNGVI